MERSVHQRRQIHGADAMWQVISTHCGRATLTRSALYSCGDSSVLGQSYNSAQITVEDRKIVTKYVDDKQVSVGLRPTLSTSVSAQNWTWIGSIRGFGSGGRVGSGHVRSNLYS